MEGEKVVEKEQEDEGFEQSDERGRGVGVGHKRGRRELVFHYSVDILAPLYIKKLPG
jgi:hypothetical protein